MELLAVVGLVTFGVVAGSYLSSNVRSPVIAQIGPGTQGESDVLWHLPRFGEHGKFFHADNAKIRA